METKVDDKTLILSVIGIMILVIVTVGVTYAVFTYSKEGTISNILRTGNMNFMYEEITKNGININSNPTEDETAKLETGEGKVFDFTVKGITKDANAISYEIVLAKGINSTLNEKCIKVYLTELLDDKEIAISETLLNGEVTRYNQLNNTTIAGETGKIVYQGIIPANTRSFKKNYRLRLWISSDTDLTLKENINKTFSSKINVYADNVKVSN